MIRQPKKAFWRENGRNRNTIRQALKKNVLQKKTCRMIYKCIIELYDNDKFIERKKKLSEKSLSILEMCGGGGSDLVKRQVAKNSGELLPAYYSFAWSLKNLLAGIWLALTVV